jgi:hypothetical protein
MQYRRSVQGRMLLTEFETSARTESKRMTNHNTPQLSRMGLPVRCATFPGLSRLNTRAVHKKQGSTFHDALLYVVHFLYKQSQDAGSCSKCLQLLRCPWHFLYSRILVYAGVYPIGVNEKRIITYFNGMRCRSTEIGILFYKIIQDICIF